ncbi:MAG: hypothetical protein QOG21_1619, partial [Actinomycetota bacterium]|nr:hypothetical protein [Actinomycetota bacterium]
GGEERVAQVLQALLDRDVVLDKRGEALRISPHFFNNEEDVDHCFEELQQLL